MASNSVDSSAARRSSVILKVVMLDLDSRMTDTAHPLSSSVIPRLAVSGMHSKSVPTRIKNCVEETVPRYSDPSFKAHFRMERTTFQAVLELVGPHIPIPGPQVFRDSFICRKGFPAVHLQCVCDSNLKLLDVFCGYPGSRHNAGVFRNSSLFTHLTENLLPSQYHLLVDSAYPLSNFLLTPFRDNGHLSREQKTYNFKHSSTRVDIERCFGFRKLKYLDMKITSKISNVIMTCCVLHNVIIKHENFLPEDIEEVEMQEIPEVEDDNAIAATAVNKRDEIMHRIA